MTSPYRLTASSIVSPMRAKEETVSPRRRRPETNRFALGATRLFPNSQKYQRGLAPSKRKLTPFEVSVLVRRQRVAFNRLQFACRIYFSLVSRRFPLLSACRKCLSA